MLADEKKTQKLGRLQTRLEFALASFVVFFSGQPERNAGVVHTEHPGAHDKAQLKEKW